MLLATTYTFGDVLLTVLEFALLIVWIWIAVGVVFDIFRSSDLSNWAKALWVLFIVVLPWIGVLAYLLARGHKMHEHQERERAQNQAFQQFTRGGAGLGTASDIEKLVELKDRGVLNEEEFERAKAKVLA